MIIFVDTGYACFGLIARSGVIVRAAPIGRWTIGKTVETVTGFYQRRNAIIEFFTIDNLIY